MARRFTFLAACGALFPICAPLLAADGTSFVPGIWTNTQDAYLAPAEGRDTPEWVGLEVAEDDRWRRVDAFGTASSGWYNPQIIGLAPSPAGGWTRQGSELRPARWFTCWVATRKDAAKPGGGEGWTFQSGIRAFDQGGRALVGGGGAAPDVTIRLRHVTWEKGSRNKPALTLYIHRDDPDRAKSYAWADPAARLVGDDLRWVQASCSREGEQT